MPVEQAKNFWLMKSEPNVFSIDDLANCNKKTEPWSGVRNYQARNFMRDDMAVGDMILFYHSSCADPVSLALPKSPRKPIQMRPNSMLKVSITIQKQL